MEEKEVKKRGRKQGSLSGPRRIYYVAAGIINNDIVLEKIEFESKDDISDLIENKVKEIFQLKYMIEPKVLGPFYDVKGVNKVEKVLKTDLNDIKIKNNVAKIASYKGTNGSVFELENSDNLLFLPKTNKNNAALVVSNKDLVFE